MFLIDSSLKGTTIDAVCDNCPNQKAGFSSNRSYLYRSLVSSIELLNGFWLSKAYKSTGAFGASSLMNCSINYWDSDACPDVTSAVTEKPCKRSEISSWCLN